jgi:hypothetical protein
MRGDREFLCTLAAIGVFDVCAGGYLIVARQSHGFLYFEVAIYLAAVLLQCLPILRFGYTKSQRYSVTGFFWLLATVGVLILWNFAIMLVGAITRWWEYPAAFGIIVRREPRAAAGRHLEPAA